MKSKQLLPMVSKIAVIVFYMFLYSGLRPSKAQAWIRAGYFWASQNEFPISDINSTLFTHLICAFADLNFTTYELYVSSSDELKFSTFTDTVKQKNPSVTTLLSIGGNRIPDSTLSLLASNHSRRKSFIDSSMKTARLYGFQGLDLWIFPNRNSEMFNMEILFRELQAAIALEAIHSNHSQLILTAAVDYSPLRDSASYPIDSIERYLNWTHVLSTDYTMPSENMNHTGVNAALYDQNSVFNTDYGINAWISAGLSPNKLVFCLPFYGYAWILSNPKVNGIGAPAIGPVYSDDGFMSYKDIKAYIKLHGGNVTFNATYVVNYCSVGKVWICFDDVEVVKIKISYAKKKKLLGYFVWQVQMDDNWKLSQAAAEDDKIIPSVQVDNRNGKDRGRLLVTIITTTAAIILLLVFVICYYWRRKLKSKDSKKQSEGPVNIAVAAGDFSNNNPNLIVYTWAVIEAATEGFSFENKLGEGGFGPVYKGILSDGQKIAVKRLSKASTQGFEEFKNEVVLTAKLQHVNLVRLLGFCIDGTEQMLIYEYMPNKSLDTYLFDPIRKYDLDWKKRVYIIEGIIQGLLYLQEYSRLTIIHRDLKVSNVLLDEDMKPKISDFGLARIFAKDNIEANTGHIVGTPGYAPPEYVKRGLYSTKSDCYSFGVLLLEVISGKRVSLPYGVNESLSLLGYAYELWKDGKGMEFIDPSLDDAYSPCKLIRCLQIALLCVQENPNDRPSVLEVSSMLKNETANLATPQKPAFSKPSDEYEGNRSRMQLESCSGSTSNCDMTVSEVVAR